MVICGPFLTTEARSYRRVTGWRVDISSADFPKYDRDTNRGGTPGAPIPARQTIYHDPEHSSHLEVRVLPG
jgi:predicted acyl esterase